MKRLLGPIIKKYWKLLAATFLTCVFGCGYCIGLAGSYRSLEATMYDYLERYQYPDAVCTTEVTDRSKLPAVAAVPGVAAVDARLCADTILEPKGGRCLSVRAFSYNPGDHEQVYYHAAADSNGADAICVEYEFAQTNSIAAGDTVQLKLGDEWRTYFVEGLVSLPETLAVQPTSEGWSIIGDFGYVYVSVDLLEKEYAQIYGEAKDTLDDKGEELASARQDADAELGDARRKLDSASAVLQQKDALLADSRKEAQNKTQELLRTREELQKKRAELVETRAELVAGRKEAKSKLAQMTAQRSTLQQAQDGLATIDDKLETVEKKEQKMLSSDVVRAVDLMRKAPPGVEIDTVLDAMDTFQNLLTSSAAYGFYYTVDEQVDAVAERLDTFLTGVRDDAAYLNSEEAAAVIQSVRDGDEGVADTPEYAAVAEAVSHYVPVAGPDALPAAYTAAKSAANGLVSLADASDLDKVQKRLASVDVTMSVKDLSARIDALADAADELKQATGTPVTTLGDATAAYDSAVAALASGRAQLEEARESITDRLAAQNVAEGEVASLLVKLDNGIDQANDVIDQINDGLPQVDDGLKQIDDGLKQIDDGLKEIDAKLAEAESQLAQAHRELNANEAAYRRSMADVLLEFASLEDELAKAYAELNGEKGYGELCNQFLLWFEDGADPEQTLSAAEAALDGVTVKSDYTFERSAVQTRIEVNLSPLRTMSTFIPAVFFAILMAIVFLFMSLIVRQCRREIGILRALGFSSGSIRLLFCGVNLLVSGTSVVLGLGLGVFLTWTVGKTYAGFFSLPSYLLRMDWPRTILCSLLTVAVGQAATLISTGLVTKISPAEAMTRPAPSTARVPGFLGRLTRRASPMTAFSITTLLRNPVRFFFSVICVAATIMMIFASRAFFTSKDRMLTQTFDDRIHYDCQILYSKPLDAETLAELKTLDYVADVQSMPYYTVDISFGDKTASAVVNALEADTQLVSAYDRSGRPLSTALSENGILLEEHLAQELGVGIGDTVLVDGRVPLQVEGLSFQCLSRCQYISPEGARALGDETLGSVICRIRPEEEARLLRYLAEQDDYLYAIFTQASYDANVRQLRSFDYAVWIIIIFAVCVGFIIVLNTARTNILEKRRELCVLRTLGFQRREISRSWFVQSVLQFAVACAVGFPWGRAVAAITLARISTENREFIYANTFRDVLITAGCVFAYIAASHLVAMHDLKGWDIVESVKEKE